MQEFNILSNSIKWKELQSVNGKTYEVGLLESDEVTHQNNVDKEDFGVGVSWSPEYGCNWKETSAVLKQRAGITKYALERNSEGSLYDYTLHFTNTKHYKYFFYDETGDCYKVDTFRNGDHFVRFSSINPTIVYISGS